MNTFDQKRWMQLAGILKEDIAENMVEGDEYQPEYDDLQSLADWYVELLQSHSSWEEAFPFGKTDVLRVVNRMEKEDPVYLLGFIRRHGQETVADFIENLI